jgi:hypothetical protein
MTKTNEIPSYYNTADEKERLIFREWLSGLLRTEHVKITFTKKDGTVRELLATLKEEVIVPYEKKTERTRSPNKDSISVWDLEKNAWRSFRYDSVSKVSFSVSGGNAGDRL